MTDGDGSHDKGSDAHNNWLSVYHRKMYLWHRIWVRTTLWQEPALRGARVMDVKTVLDLLDHDVVFSQRGPLSVTDFLAASKERGVDLERGHLDALHGAGILIPMYRVARDMKAVRGYLRQERQRAGRWSPASEVPAAHILTTGPDLRGDRDDGRVFDPRTEPYRAWSRYERTMGMYLGPSPDGVTYPEIINASEFLYSPYQLLQLTELPPIIARMRTRRTGTHRTYAVADQDRDRHSTVRSLFATTDLIVGLSALEDRYLPRVIGYYTNLNYGGLEEWEAYAAAFDPRAMHAWLGWTPEQIRTYAVKLLTVAHRVDPNRDVHDLMELWRPSARERLRDAALIAVDYRVAAEILLRFYEDLVRHGAADLLPEGPANDAGLFDGRYVSDRTRLDRVLRDYGISPHPRVVLVLEGETEYKIMMRRTLDFLGIVHSRTTIHLAVCRREAGSPSRASWYSRKHE